MTDRLRVGLVGAVAFAVPPDVQVPLAVEAAKAGRHLILEKPIASTLDEAQPMVDAVSTAGVASIVVLVLRFAPETQGLADLDDVHGRLARRVGAVAVRGAARWAVLGVTMATRARRDHRHRAARRRSPRRRARRGDRGARGEPLRTGRGHLILAHRGGATSTVSLSMRLPLIPTSVSFDVYGQFGHLALSPRSIPAEDCYLALLDDLVGMVRAGFVSHPCDVHRGLHLQRVLDAARRLSRA